MASNEREGFEICRNRLRLSDVPESSTDSGTMQQHKHGKTFHTRAVFSVKISVFHSRWGHVNQGQSFSQISARVLI